MTFEFSFFFFSFRVEIIRPHYNHKENLRIITCPQLIPKNDPPKNLTLYLAGHVKNLSSVKMAQNPPIMWAQDHEHVFVTIKLHDVIDEEIKFHSNGFYFKGKTKKPEQTYETTFTLFNEILPNDEETKYQKLARDIKLNMRKKDANSWWPRLAQTSAKLHNVSIDWDKWVDDSDEDINDGSFPIGNTPDDEWTDTDDEEDVNEDKEDENKE